MEGRQVCGSSACSHKSTVQGIPCHARSWIPRPPTHARVCTTEGAAIPRYQNILINADSNLLSSSCCFFQSMVYKESNILSLSNYFYTECICLFVISMLCFYVLCNCLPFGAYGIHCTSFRVAFMYICLSYIV